MSKPLDYSSITDRRLVELHLDGDRTAFRHIVERYQAMVCALGLSACGDVARSEDLAQEVFIVAWKQLPELREPEKLRGWLAAIARNLIHHSFRRQQRTPTALAEPLSLDTPAGGDNPRDHAISADEAALTWKALEGIPENYREPMVLFYREHRSAAAVAAALEITEDAVRQRLARGRAMLTERMAKLVEETLERSAPTPAFASAVLLALPLGVVTTAVKITTGAAGASLGTGGATTKTVAGGFAATAAKGGVLAIVAALPAILVGVRQYLEFRTRFEATASAAQQRSIAAGHLVGPLLVAATCITMVTLFLCAEYPMAVISWWGLSLLGCVVLLVLALLILALAMDRRRDLAVEERVQVVDGALSFKPVPVARTFEYRSQRSFLGLPLVHLLAHVGGSSVATGRSARGWIAMSNSVAWGGFFACGSLAVAPLSMGIGAIGLLSLGALGLGAGVVGGLVCGVFSSGVIAFGWTAARGETYAAAGDFAHGFYAVAPHANDAVATAYFHGHLFFRLAPATAEMNWVWMVFLWLTPLALIGWRLWRTRSTR